MVSPGLQWERCLLLLLSSHACTERGSQGQSHREPGTVLRVSDMCLHAKTAVLWSSFKLDMLSYV